MPEILPLDPFLTLPWLAVTAAILAFIRYEDEVTTWVKGLPALLSVPVAIVGMVALIYATIFAVGVFYGLLWFLIPAGFLYALIRFLAERRS